MEPVDVEIPEVVEEAEAGQEDEAAAPPAPAPHPVPRARVRPAPRPVTPTREQGEEHELTHLPHAPWCRH